MGLHYQQLTLHERYQIQILNDMGLSARAIAKRIHRGNRTVSSELNRRDDQPYCAKSAHALALTARQKRGSIAFSQKN